MRRAQPQRLRADERGLVLAPGAVQARDVRGGAVGEEVEDGERRRQHGRRDRQRRELRPSRGGRRSRCRRARRAARRPAPRGRAARARRSGGRRASGARRATLAPGNVGPRVKLRLYHHPDGARVAYREAGTGPPLVLLHSKLLSHREWEPLVEELADRFRLVLPDLPLHGDSEDRPEPPVHAGLAGRGDGRLLPRRVRPAPARRRPRGRRAAAAARDRHAPAHARAAGADVERDAPPPGARAARARGRRSACAPPPCPGLDRVDLPRRPARLPAQHGRAADRARQPRRARPRAPRVHGRRAATPTGRARGRAPRAAGPRARRATCSTPTG